MLTPDQRIARLAERQHGVFTFDQALASGFTPDMVHSRAARGRWIRIHRGVYAVAGVPLSFESRALASVFRAGPGAGASHTTASALWRIEGILASGLHVTVPARRSVTIPGVHVHRPRDLAARDVVPLGQIPVTTPARTIIDLESCVAVAVLQDGVDDLARRGKIDVSALLERVRRLRGPGRSGLRSLEHMLEERIGRRSSGSKRERELGSFLVSLGLPRPIPQFEVRSADGSFVAFLDYAYPEAKVFIEFDGYEKHSSRRQWESDRVRQNRLVELGWQPLRITSRQLDDPSEDIVRTVWGALTASRTTYQPQTAIRERFGTG